MGECQAKLPESKYGHLSAEDVATMEKTVGEGWKYFTEVNSKIKCCAKDQVRSLADSKSLNDNWFV